MPAMRRRSRSITACSTRGSEDVEDDLEAGGVLALVGALGGRRVEAEGQEERLDVLALGEDRLLERGQDRGGLLERRAHRQLDLEGELALVHLGQELGVELDRDHRR